MAHYLRKLHLPVGVIIFTTMLGAHGIPAYAQTNPEIANCQEISDADTQTQVDICTAHVGCKLVMGIQKACTNVKTFLNNLKNLSFGKNKIDSSDVFDAAAPSAEGDAIFNNISKSIKTSYDKQPKKKIVNGESADGSKWVYEGPMNKGERHGTGVLITEEGTMFRGEFVKGLQKGKGELVDDKSRKAGVMDDLKLEGLGVERDADGVRYEGEYKAGIYNGQGVMTWPSGNQYEGSYKDGARNGQGTIKLADGAQYTGNWVADKKQGRGTYTWSDGDRFEGEWRDNKPFNGAQINTNGTRIEIANGVKVESPQEAAARIAKSYDDRITAAHEQCSSSESTCNTDCTADTLASLLSILASEGEDSNEASAEALQCINHCDAAKRSCEDQVSALEQEKNQAIANAAAPPAPATDGKSQQAATSDSTNACGNVEQDFAEFTQRYPLQPHWGIRDTYQYAYFLGTEGLNILQRHKACMPAADFSANYAALEQSRETGRENCTKVAVDPDSCVPSYPGQ